MKFKELGMWNKLAIVMIGISFIGIIYSIYNKSYNSLVTEVALIVVMIITIYVSLKNNNK